MPTRCSLVKYRMGEFEPQPTSSTVLQPRNAARISECIVKTEGFVSARIVLEGLREGLEVLPADC